jgi:hypothetical protein
MPLASIRRVERVNHPRSVGVFQLGLTLWHGQYISSYSNGSRVDGVIDTG